MARGFPNIVDYVRERLDTFEQRDVCRVDSLVFSWLSYYRLPPDAQDACGSGRLTIRDLYRAEWFGPMCGKLYNPQESLELLSAVTASPRFRDVVVSDYISRTDERAEQQFSAMTFEISSHQTFVAFRGTDNTLVGWKEDFNMAFQTAIPSQVAATYYLEHVAARTSGRIWCGGHSKGGNLAVYAGMMCPDAVFERLVTCFSHDGPGFTEECMARGRWEAASGVVDKTVPQSSVVGMIFERQEQECRVVRSHAIGFSQHDPLSWEVDGLDFVPETKVGLGASTFDASVNSWLASASNEERERFVDAVFTVLSAAGQDTMGGIKSSWRTSVPKMLSAAASLVSENRQVIMTAVGDVARAMNPVSKSTAAQQ